MAGAEEFYRLRPSIRDYLYTPDPRLDIDLIASSARRQREDIRDIGESNVERQRSKYQTIPLAIQAFQQARQAETDEALRQKQLERADVSLAEEKQGMQEAEDRRKFLAGLAPGPEGKSRQQALWEAEYQAKLKEPEFKAEEQRLTAERLKKDLKVVDMQLAQQGFATETAKEDKYRNDLKDAFSGAYSSADAAENPQAAEQKADAVEQKALIDSKVPPAVITAYRNAARGQAGSARAQGYLAQQIPLQGTAPYQHMEKVTTTEGQKISAANELVTLRNQYNAYLRLGFFEKPQAENAKQRFAEILRQLDRPEEAAEVESIGWQRIPTKMNQSIGSVFGELDQSLPASVNTIDPKMMGQPQVRTLLDNYKQAKSRAGSASGDRNQLNLLQTGGQPQSPASMNQAFIQGQNIPVTGTPIPGGGGIAPNPAAQGGMAPGVPQAPFQSLPYNFGRYRKNSPVSATNLKGQ